MSKKIVAMLPLLAVALIAPACALDATDTDSTEEEAEDLEETGQPMSVDCKKPGATNLQPCGPVPEPPPPPSR